MIKLNATDIIKENKEPKASQVKQETPQEQSEATSRPEVVDAKVYKQTSRNALKNYSEKKETRENL